MDLSASLLILEDPDNILDIDQVSQLPDERFTANPGGTPNFGITDATIWLKVPLNLPADLAERCIIEYATAFTDHVRVYLPASLPAGTDWQVLEGGDQVPHAALPFDYPNYLFPIPSDSGVTTLFIELRSEGAIQAPLRLWRESELIAHAGRTQLAYGLFYAVMLALLSYNLLLYGVIRDRAYLYYVGYLGGICAFQATFYGHVQAYLWPPDLPLFNALSVLFLMLGIASGMQFARLICEADRYTPGMSRLLRISMWGVLAYMPVMAFFYGQLIPSIPAISVVSLILILHTVVLCSLRGSRSARLTLIAFFAIVPGGIALALRNLGIIEPSFFAEHGLQFGTALEAILLSLVLADRINTLKRARDSARIGMVEAQQQALEQQRRFSRHLLAAQDQERKRIAQELHDGVGQIMLALVNGLKRLSRTTTDAADMEQLASGSVQDLRQISHRLHPHLLDRLGLAEALKASANSLLAETGTQLRLDVDENIKLSEDQKLQLYRICQEALSNSAKYAQAEQIRLTLSQSDQQLCLEIRDDGQGFDPQQVGIGLGLQNMRERAELLGGHLDLVASPGAGCRISIGCPA